MTPKDNACLGVSTTGDWHGSSGKPAPFSRETMTLVAIMNIPAKHSVDPLTA